MIYFHIQILYFVLFMDCSALTCYNRKKIREIKKKFAISSRIFAQSYYNISPIFWLPVFVFQHKREKEFEAFQEPVVKGAFPWLPKKILWPCTGANWSPLKSLWNQRETLDPSKAEDLKRGGRESCNCVLTKWFQFLQNMKKNFIFKGNFEILRTIFYKMI